MASGDQNPVHTYAEAGYYKVRLISGDTISGCKSRHYELINVGVGNQGLKAGFGYEEDTLNFKAGGYPVDFVGVAVGKPAKMVWDFGDGSKDSSSVELTHEYTKPGTYTVCFTIEDQVTGESDTECEEIVVEGEENLAPGIPEGLVSSDITENSFVISWTSSVDNEGDPITYVIYVDGVEVGTTTSNSYSVGGLTAETTYDVRVTAKDDQGNESEMSTALSVTTNPVGIISVYQQVNNIVVYPNPFTGYTNVKYTLAEKTRLEITIYDQVGKEVQTIISAVKDAGNYEFVWDGSWVSKGAYIMKFKTSDGFIRNKVIIKR
jgi:PKD repeat protein